MTSSATAVADLQHTLQRIQGEDQDEAPVLWKNWQNRPSDTWMFSGEMFYARGFWQLPILRKALKSSTEMAVPRE